MDVEPPLRGMSDNVASVVGSTLGFINFVNQIIMANTPSTQPKMNNIFVGSSLAIYSDIR